MIKKKNSKSIVVVLLLTCMMVFNSIPVFAIMPVSNELHIYQSSEASVRYLEDYKHLGELKATINIDDGKSRTGGSVNLFIEVVNRYVFFINAHNTSAAPVTLEFDVRALVGGTEWQTISRPIAIVVPPGQLVPVPFGTNLGFSRARVVVMAFAPPPMIALPPVTVIDVSNPFF